MSDPDTHSRAALIRQMYAASDSGDVEGLLERLDDDIVLVFSNSEPVHGKEAVKSTAGQVTTKLKGVRHEIHELWSAAEDADVIIARMTVHYTRFDGTTVSLPCCNVYRMKGDLIGEYRVYMDITPVFA